MKKPKPPLPLLTNESGEEFTMEPVLEFRQRIDVLTMKDGRQFPVFKTQQKFIVTTNFRSIIHWNDLPIVSPEQYMMEQMLSKQVVQPENDGESAGNVIPLNL